MYTIMAHSKVFKLKKIGLVIKHHQPEAASFAAKIAEFILSQNLKIFFAQESELLAKDLIRSLKVNKLKIRTVPKPKLVDYCDLIVVLGGDGTFLSIARMMKNRSIPIMGVNMGQLGFLTEIKRDEAINELKKMILGTPPPISTRALLEVTLTRKNKIILQEPIVNDAVISKGAIARIIGMEIWVDGQWVCPHSLTSRPVIIPDTSEVKICLNDRPGHVLLTLDGQDAIDMKEDDLVTIRPFKKHCLKIVTSHSRNYFTLLREKLKFGVRD
jgi:NAD+ kinase